MHVDKPFQTRRLRELLADERRQARRERRVSLVDGQPTITFGRVAGVAEVGLIGVTTPVELNGAFVLGLLWMRKEVG